MSALNDPQPTAFVVTQPLSKGSTMCALDLAWNDAAYKASQGDVALYTLADAMKLLSTPQLDPEEANALLEKHTDLTKVVDWNATNRQISLIMALRGDENQKEQARRYFKSHGLSALRWFSTIVQGTEYRE